MTGVVSVIGVSTLNPTPNAGHLAITLKTRDERRATAVADIVDRLKSAVASIPGMVVYFQPVQDIQISTRTSRAQYQYTLSGTDAQAVSDWSVKLADRLRAEPALRGVASEAQEGGLRTFIDVDREQAGRLGISMQVINDTLSDAFAQRQISTIYGQSNQYRVILEAMPQYQQDPSSLSKLFVSSANGAQVPIAAFTGIQRTVAPLTISHQAQFPAVTISFDLAPDASLSGAVAAIARAERDIRMPGTIIGAYSGAAAEFSHSLAGEPWLILAAAVTIYIVLGVLYESFIHPLTILSTLPSAGVGALLALMLTRQDLSVVALIGIILLMGIVKKNAIIMIDFALEAQRKDRLSRGCHRQGFDAALPADHDDNARRAVRRTAAGARERYRLRAALPARRHHHRRLAAEPVAHALHHTGDLPLYGADTRAGRANARAESGIESFQVGAHPARQRVTNVGA